MADRPDPTDAASGPDGHDEAALSVAARHALHDEELISALADVTVSATALEADEAARARALVERCPACRDLHADLVAIAAAHRATAAMAITAPRDFRISPERAGRAPSPGAVAPSPAAVAPSPSAMPIGLLDRLRAAVGSVGRPLGGTLVAAGLVGLVVGSVSLGAIPAGAPTSRSDATLGGADASHEIVFGPQGPAPAPTPAAQDGKAASATATDGLASGPVVVLAASSTLLVLGLALFVGARRMRHPGG